MADKPKVKWYNALNPWAHMDAKKKATAKKPGKKKETVTIDWAKRVKEQEAAKKAAVAKKAESKKAKVKVVKPADNRKVVKVKSSR